MNRLALRRNAIAATLVMVLTTLAPPSSVAVASAFSIDRGASAVELPLANSATSLFAAQPLENQLSAGTTNLLRTLRKRMRQLVRVLRYGAAQWSSWLGGLVLFLIVALVVPLLGRDNLRTFREHGFLAFMRELSLALAVYVRLLIDGRTPVVGKALLLFAIVYGAAPRDLFPDRFALNFVDDLILLVLASRSFMMLCPQEIVEEHALAAARAREESLRKKLSRRRGAKGTSTASSAAAESNH